MKWTPKPGQTDYTHAPAAPVINCVVSHNGLILIIQRAHGSHFYPSLWSGVSGFLDDDKSPQEKARDELEEEIAIPAHDILLMREGKVFEEKDPRYGKIWIVHPLLIEVDTSLVTLNSEADAHEWIDPQELHRYSTVPGFAEVVRQFFSV